MSLAPLYMNVNFATKSTGIIVMGDINLKVFGRKRSWFYGNTLLAFSWREKPRKLAVATIAALAEIRP
jgi:hypothetical protein